MYTFDLKKRSKRNGNKILNGIGTARWCILRSEPWMMLLQSEAAAVAVADSDENTTVAAD